jgi:hypothetical protein
MTTAELYERLSGRFSEEPFVLKPGDLGALSPQLKVVTAGNSVRAYFANGAIKLTGLKPVNRPAAGKRIQITGSGAVAPFAGMEVRLELWTEEIAGGNSELHLAVSAYGARADQHWTLGENIPVYEGSLLGGLRFALPNDAQYPLLTFSSHVGGADPKPALFCMGMVELNSIAAAAPSQFVGNELMDKYVLAAGTLVAFDPLGGDDGRAFRPFVSLMSALPEPAVKRTLADRFPIGNLRYLMSAKPVMNLANYKWEADCSFVWSAELELKPAGAGENAAAARKLPLGMQIKHKGAKIRLWANLKDGVALGWDTLANSIPGFPANLPDTGFSIEEDIRLTNIEFIGRRAADRELKLESVSLRIQTNEDRNRWVLIEDLLTLDAIDFFVVVNDPLGSPSAVVTLTGLVGIGEKATLALTADLSHVDGQTDFGFSGGLTNDGPLEINEVLTQFLGHSNYPTIGKLTVEAFSFSVRPRSRTLQGEIEISADWKLADWLSLRNVHFAMKHAGGEGDTEFQANGVFLLGETQIYVSADYVSNGQGWTFSGGTFDEEEIPIGDWLSDVWALWSPKQIPAMPDALKDLVLVNLGVRINTTTKDYSFQGTARFPIDGNKDNTSKAELTVQVDREGDSATFRGALTILERDFEVVFNNAGLLVGTYDGSNAKGVDLRELVSEISKTIGDQIAAGISINLAHAQLAYSKGAQSSKFLFGVELDAGIQLSNLPVVGFLFDRDQTLNVVFQLLAVSQAFEAAEIRAINELTGPEITKIPEARLGGARAEDWDFSLKAAVIFGGSTHEVALPLATDVHTAPASKKLPISSAADRATKWVKIDKALGPFHFQRLGISTNGSDLSFLMDAWLETAGLTISLEGLEARCTFADLSKGEFHPEFDLRGLGIAFKSGDLEIGGALVHRPAPAKDAYDGAVVIHYKRLGIEAIGSYETIDGLPALFIYALIDYPLGGPAFFFVEGGAIGFGYNRSFTAPTIDQVAEFPLVKQATAPSATKLTPLQLADQLKPYVTPVAGQYFITAGIKFSSFKTIKGFVLLTVLFGEHFEIDVVGKATLTSPPNVESGKSMMSATLMLLGRFLPEEGLLMVMAQLAPDARLFAPDCHLSGGFALYCWFDGEHKGDFVLTLGGYHKLFNPPPHYPRVPRLAMNWQVDANLSLKAEAYFALTPSALMAGGKLEANWQSGGLQAWFRAEIDFLIAWQPFYYNGRAYCSLGARYRFEFFGTHEISAELTAELNVWGPPFSGRARVQWNLISFEIAFGDKELTAPAALDWPTFRKSFLPEGRMFTVNVEKGKVAQGGSQERAADATHLGTINPRNLCVVVRSPLPVKIAGNDLLKNALEAQGRSPDKEPVLGIAPMDRKAAQWKSTVSVTIWWELGGNQRDDRTAKFQATRIRGNVPVSLWGETMDPKARAKDAPQLIKDAICGYEIRPLNPSEMQSPDEFTVTRTGQNAELKKATAGAAVERRSSTDSANEIAASLLNSDVQKRRREILKELLPETEADWGSVTIASWRGVPEIVKPQAQAG